MHYRIFYAKFASYKRRTNKYTIMKLLSKEQVDEFIKRHNLISSVITIEWFCRTYGFSKNTYYRVMNNSENLTADTLIRVTNAQKKEYEKAIKKLTAI